MIGIKDLNFSLLLEH